MCAAHREDIAPDFFPLRNKLFMPNMKNGTILYTEKNKIEVGRSILQLWDTAGQERFRSITRYGKEFPLVLRVPLSWLVCLTALGHHMAGEVQIYHHVWQENPLCS